MPSNDHDDAAKTRIGEIVAAALARRKNKDDPIPVEIVSIMVCALSDEMNTSVPDRHDRIKIRDHFVHLIVALRPDIFSEKGVDYPVFEKMLQLYKHDKIDYLVEAFLGKRP